MNFIFWTLLILLIFFIVIVAIILCIPKFKCQVNRNNKISLSARGKGSVANFPIDAVITWVDGDDPEWIKILETNKILFEKSDKVTRARFGKKIGDHLELVNCIKSIRLNTPWIETIYIVTMRPQRPPYAAMMFPNIKIVYHDEIFPNKSHLPTFCSTAIECWLWKIPDLSEHFIYLNDDCFFGLPLTPRDFFYNKLPIFRAQRYQKTLAYIFGEVIRGTSMSSTHNACAFNTHKALKTRNAKLVFPLHQAMAMTKSAMEHTYHLFSEEWNATSSSKFRNRSSIIPVWMAASLGLKEKTFVTKPYNDITAKFEIIFNQKDIDKFFAQEQMFHLMCFNDETAPSDTCIVENFVPRISKKLSDIYDDTKNKIYSGKLHPITLELIPIIENDNNYEVPEPELE